MPDARGWCRWLALAGFVALAPGQGGAAGLDVPANARLAAAENQTPGQVVLPISPWRDGGFETLTVEGNISQQAWQINASGLTTLQLLAPLRSQLEAEGYTILFECVARDCGGFEFRYALPVMAPPAMHVDLGDYRYLTAQRPDPEGVETTSLLVSRSAGHGFLQITQVGAQDLPPGATQSTGDSVAIAAPAPVPALTGSIPDQLRATGHAVLTGLSFRTGSSDLAGEEFAALAEVAAFLDAYPDASVVLVGHSDTEGSLAGNVALSRKRAAAVVQRLQTRYGIAADRMQADGVGYLAPLTSNATVEGRLLNRRVEVVLTAGGP
jgi:OOP family OmpA-OmpF porin